MARVELSETACELVLLNKGSAQVEQYGRRCEHSLNREFAMWLAFIIVIYGNNFIKSASQAGFVCLTRTHLSWPERRLVQRKPRFDVFGEAHHWLGRANGDLSEVHSTKWTFCARGCVWKVV